MKTLMKLLLLAMSLSMAGCYKTKSVKQIRFNMDAQDKEILMGQCEEMKSFGDINELLKEIKKDTKTLLSLLEDEDMLKNKSGISKLAERIDMNSKGVIALSKNEWIESRWDFEAEWVIDKEDFNDVVGTHIKKAFLIKDASLQKIYFHGEERIDLLNNITVTQKYNNVNIRYKNRGNSLELCQLHKTMMVLVNVKYRNITNINNRYFNLSLNY